MLRSLRSFFWVWCVALWCIALGFSVSAHADLVLITDFNSDSIGGANGWANYRYDASSNGGAWTLFSNEPGDNIFGSVSGTIDISGAVGVQLTGAFDHVFGLSSARPGHFDVTVYTQNGIQKAKADFTFWEFKDAGSGVVTIFKPFSYVDPGFNFSAVAQFAISSNDNIDSMGGGMFVSKLEASSVPEPSSLLLATPLLLLGRLRRRFKESNNLIRTRELL